MPKVRLYYFKDKHNKIISITLPYNDLNNLIIGEYFELKEKTHDYKGLTVLPENMNILYSKVLITKKYNDTYFEGMLNNKLITIKANIKSYYIGKEVLIELVKKYISIYTISGKKCITTPDSKIFLNLNINNNWLVTDDLNNNYIVTKNDIIVSNNNIGKKLCIKLYDMVYILYNTFKLTDDKKDNKLIQIKKEFNGSGLTGNLIYYFLNNNGKIIISIIPESIIIDGLLGKYFLFKYFQIYYLYKILPNTGNIDDEYLLVAILENNVYIFYKNNIVYYVNINIFIISSSSIGKSFNILIIKNLFTSYISDVIV